jgi:hypothetical protein
MADVTTTFAAKDENFAKTVDGLQKKMDGFGKQMEGFNATVGNVGGALMGVAGKLAGFAAGFVAVQAVVGAFKDAIDMGGQLNDLSARTGETAGNLMILQRAFENAGAGADSVGQQLNKLQRFMYEARDASSEQGKTLASLGISYDELKGKAPIDQMQMLADKIAGVKDDGERAALAIALFGKSGGELLPLLRGMTDGIDQARAQLGSAPDAINATAKALDDIGDNLGAIAEKSKEFALGLLTELAPALFNVTTKMATIDATGFGMAIAGYIEATLRWVSATFGLGSALDSIKAAIDGIASGNFAQGFDLLFLTAKNTGLNMINVLYAAGKAAIQTTMDALSTVFGSNSGFVKLVSYSFRYLGKIFKSEMADAIATVMSGIPFISEEAVSSMQSISKEAELAANGLKMRMGTAAKQIGKDLGEAFANGPTQFAAHYDANMKQPLFDITDSIAKQVELQKQLTDQVDLTAFAETKLGQEIDKNTQKKIAQLAGGDQKYAGTSDAEAAAAMAAGSYAGAGMNEAAIAAAQAAAGAGGGGSGSGGGRSGGSSTPMSEMDRLKASGSVGALADAMRIADQKAEDQARAQAAAAKGSYYTAARIMQRADERELRSIENARLKDRARQEGFDNFDQMFNAANEDMPIRGKMTKEEYKKLLEGSSMSDQEKRDAQAGDQGKGGKGGGGGEGSGLLEAVKSIQSWMEKNLPSNAMTT